MTRVLALDLSSTSGAAFDGPGGKPQFSTLKGRMPEDENFGPLFAPFRNWLGELVMFQRPEMIIFEAPWIPMGDQQERGGRMNKVALVYMLIGLAAVAEEFAATNNIKCYKEAVSTVRKYFIGTGRAEKPKDVVMARCRRLGWHIKNDHEGDAAALWAFAKSEIDRAFVLPPPGLLFTHGARVTA